MKVIALMAGTLMLAMAGSVAPSQAAPTYKWCVRYIGLATNCGFWTHEQCREAENGNNDECMLSPGYISKYISEHPDDPRVAGPFSPM